MRMRIITTVCLACFALIPETLAQSPVPSPANPVVDPRPAARFGQGSQFLPPVRSAASLQNRPAEPLPLPAWPRDLGPLTLTIPGLPSDLEKAVLETMTRARLKAPEGRTKHFAWLKNFQASSIKGWRGVVTDIEPIPGGHLVTVRVDILIEMAFAGDRVTERYTVINGKASFLDGNFGPHPGVGLLFGF